MKYEYCWKTSIYILLYVKHVLLIVINNFYILYV